MHTISGHDPFTRIEAKNIGTVYHTGVFNESENLSNRRYCGGNYAGDRLGAKRRVTGFNVWSILAAFLGAVVSLVLYHAMTGQRRTA